MLCLMHILNIIAPIAEAQVYKSDVYIAFVIYVKESNTNHCECD